MKISLLSLLVLALTLCSCSDKLIGTWAIQKLETKRDGKDGISLNNIGNITFKKDGKGEKNLSYNIFGKENNDVQPFTWRKTGTTIYLEGGESELSKAWIIVKDKSKDQTWQTTDGANQVQILELKKKK